MNSCHWMDDRLRLALLKENRHFRGFWARWANTPLWEAEVDTLSRFSEELAAFGMCVEIKALHTMGWVDGWRQVATVLNPAVEELPETLPLHFDRPAAMALVVDNSDPDAPWESYQRVSQERATALRPSERLLLINLERPKAEILTAVADYIDTVNELRREPPDRLRDNYAQWSVEATRRRQETWDHLRVWRLRRQRKTYLEIKRSTGIRVPAAKKAFARAFELIEGRKFDPVYYQKHYEKINKFELPTTCGTCPHRNTCSDPCPDMLAFIDQDQVGQSHLLLSDLIYTP